MPSHLAIQGTVDVVVSLVMVYVWVRLTILPFDRSITQAQEKNSLFQTSSIFF